jgi:predicted RNase H-like nuclease (RuvC/YqgF family)
MRLCRHCGIVEHPIDKDTCIVFEGNYYCGLACFNSEVNYDDIDAARNQIDVLESKIEDLENEIRDLEDSNSTMHYYYDNLEEVRSKVIKVYAMYEEDKKKHLQMLDDAITDLMDYFDEEVNLD